jgi:micrococcal nuclease
MRASQPERIPARHWNRLLAALVLLPASAGAQLYHWVDKQGVPHYSDRPPPAGAERIDAAERPATREVSVTEVIDGDTVMLAEERRLRLIGIDAPEMPHRGHPGEAGADAARARLQQMLADAELRLEPGDTARDDYDRLLGYLHDARGRDIGAEMLRAGYAVVSLHEDNAARADAYFAAEAAARDAGRGLWAEPALQPLPAAEAAAHRNSYRQLEGRVVAARAGRADAELRLEGGLRLAVDEPARKRFSGAALRALEGERVRVRGVIRQRDGKPLIHLRHPAQLDRL